MNLTTLTDEQFADEVDARLFEDEMWADLKEPEVIDRTRVALTATMVVVDQQLAHRAGKPGQEGWERKARGYRAQLQRRLVPIKGIIRDRDRAELLALENGRKEWEAFALELAEALEESDMGFMLDEIDRGEGSARSWLRVNRWRAAA
jgi:hypothetical protein